MKIFQPKNVIRMLYKLCRTDLPSASYSCARQFESKLSLYSLALTLTAIFEQIVVTSPSMRGTFKIIAGNVQNHCGD